MKTGKKAMAPRDRMVLWGMNEIGRLRSNGADEGMLKAAERAWKKAIRAIYPARGEIGIGHDMDVAGIVSTLLGGRNVAPIRKTDFNADGTCPRQAAMFMDRKTGRFYDTNRVTVVDQYGTEWYGAFPELEDEELIRGITMPYLPESDCHGVLANTFTYDMSSGRVILPETMCQGGHGGPFNAMEVTEVDGRELERSVFFLEGKRWDVSDEMRRYVQDRIEQDLVKKGFILA